VGGVVSTPEGFHIVPHTPSGRVQVYDADWTFLTGWYVDAFGGTFKLLAPVDGHIDVITARGDRHYVFDTGGQLISKSSYRPNSYDSFPEVGVSAVVPTAPWLWVFSNPAISWAVLMIGFVPMIVIRLADKRKAATHSDGTACR